MATGARARMACRELPEPPATIHSLFSSD